MWLQFRWRFSAWARTTASRLPVVRATAREQVGYFASVRGLAGRCSCGLGQTRDEDDIRLRAKSKESSNDNVILVMQIGVFAAPLRAYPDQMTPSTRRVPHTLRSNFSKVSGIDEGRTPKGGALSDAPSYRDSCRHSCQIFATK